MFSSETYILRRQTLMRRMGNGILVFPGNSYCSMNFPANGYPFRQDSSFLYYFGIDAPDLTALIDCDSGSVIVFGNEPTIDDKVWTGPQPSLKEQAEKSGVDDVRSIADLCHYLQDAARSSQRIHFLPFYRAQQRIAAAGWLDVPVERIGDYISLEMIKSVVAQRNIKTAEEIEQIELAVDLSGYMQLGAMELCGNGIFESEIVAELSAIVTSYGSAFAFPPIFSIHGEILHNPYYKNQMFDGDIAVCDCGAESPLHYAGDLTRTIPVGGKFTDVQKEIYSIVLNAMEDAIDMLKPGIMFRDIHLHACEKLAYGLKCLGLMKGDHKEAVALGAHALFFQCGLGHMMGLDVHDMEALGEQYVGYGDHHKSTQFGLKSLRLAKELQVGNVVTIEPGIYFIPQLIDMWKEQGKFDDFINYDRVEDFRDFGGIRIEDDYLITQDGSRLLGAPVPRTISEVEDACRA